MKLKLQMGDEQYQIVEAAGKTESDLADYGELCELEVGGKRFIALCAKDENDEIQSALGEKWVYEATPVECEVEDVDIEVEEDDETGLGEDDEEEEELEPTRL